jgi:hypothetical protein
MPTPRGGSGRGRSRRRQHQFAALRAVPAAVQLEAASSLLNRAPLFVAVAVVLVWAVVLAGLVLQVPVHHLQDRLLLQDLLRLPHHLRLQDVTRESRFVPLVQKPTVAYYRKSAARPVIS